MKHIHFLIGLLALGISSFANAQGNNCINAAPLCTDSPITFPAGTNSGTGETGPDYGCLGSEPNPAWYFLQIADPGSITFTLTTSPSEDIDFILWGPFASQSAPCTDDLTDANEVDCSYSSASTETAVIPNAQTGELYILLITNYSNDPTSISVSQTGGTGTTDCGAVIPCDLVVDAGPDINICVGEPQLLNGSFTDDAGNTSYTWTSVPAEAVNDLDDPTLLTPTFTPTINYDSVVFTLTVADDGASLGTCTRTDEVTVYFRPLPSLSYNPNVCPNDDASFVFSGIEGDTINYTLNGVAGIAAIDQSGEVVITTENVTESQELILTSGSIGTCPLSADDLDSIGNGFITMYPISIDTLIQYPADCGVNNGAVQAVASNFQGTPSYLWSGPGPDSPNTFQATVWQNLSSGWYYFSVSDNVCTINDSVFVEQNNQPVAQFEADPTSGNAPLNVVFTNNSENASSFEWDFGNGETASVNDMSSQNTTYGQEGVYIVTLTAIEGECTDVATQEIVVNLILPLSYDLPNVFTPNGDGSNDVFTVNAQNATSMSLSITNRWGNIVFQSDDVNATWNGRIMNTGEMCAEGVYFYTLKIAGADLEQISEHNFVHLVLE